MTIATASIVSAFITHLQASGKFDQALAHEPKNPPTGSGVTAGVMVQSIEPVPNIFGALAATSVRVLFMVRLYRNMLTEPQDDIDGQMLDAVDSIAGLVSGDFTLGDRVDFVDLLGQGGIGLQADFGYATLGQTVFRIADVSVPVIIGDLWTQAR